MPLDAIELMAKHLNYINYPTKVYVQSPFILNNYFL